MRSTEPFTIKTFAVRALAATAAAATVGGRYQAPGAILDRGLAFVLRRGSPSAPTPDATLAADRWEAAVRAVPDRPILHCLLAGALRNHGAGEHARKVIEAATERFPDHPGAAVEAARVAESCDDHAEACRHWQRAFALTRARPHWLASAAQCLVRLERVAEAQALLTTARADHPRHAGLMAADIMLALRKHEWQRAASLSQEFHRRFPDHPGAREQLGESLYFETLSRFDDNAVAATPPTRAQIGRVEDDEVRQLLARFESLGDNCEFGLVQRRYGAEPIGLLRWNIVESGNLIEALRHGLEGLGTAEHTELITSENGEFFVFDRRWFLGMHTFLYASQTTHEELYPAMLRRITALRERFMADLAAGAKTYVYRSNGIDRAELIALSRALQAFGPAALLAVEPLQASTASGGQAGEIEVVEPGCYVGFLRRAGLAADNSWNIAYEDWISVCRKAEVAATARAEETAR